MTALLAAGAVASGLAFLRVVAVHDRDATTPLPTLRQRNGEAILVALAIGFGFAALGSVLS